jgi:hypothetical protein
VEDLRVFRVKKETKRSKEHEYLHAAWMVGGKTHNVYPGELQEDEPPGGAGESETNEGAGAGIEK